MTNRTISIPTDDGTAEAYVARPDDSEHRGVLLFMDAIGLRPQIEKMADRIAGWGYVVLAPNLFYRSGTADQLAPTTDLRVPENRQEFFKGVMPRLRGLSTAKATSDIGHYLDALQQLPGVRAGKVGVTGYCMGGRLSFATAGAFPDRVAAAGSFHAAHLVSDDADSPHLLADRIQAELVFGHADKDKSNPASDIATLERALDQAGVTYDSQVYTGASHGYTMADTAPYDEEAAERHYDALRALFDRALG